MSGRFVGDEDDPALDVEPVHLDQELVERLLPLVVATAESRSAVAAHGVDLVNEDDGGRVGLGLFEQVANPAGADTDEHLDEVGTRDGVEGHPGLTRDGPGQQRLAGSRRAVEQDPLGNLGSDRLELARVFEELLDLLELLDGLVRTGHVGERRLRRVLAHQLRLGLAEVHDPVTAALHLVHEKEQQKDDQQYGQQVQQERDQDVSTVDRDVVGDPLVAELVRQDDTLFGDIGRLELLAVLRLDLDELLRILDLGLRHLAFVDLLLDEVQVSLAVLTGTREDARRENDHEQDQEQQWHPAAEDSSWSHLSGAPDTSAPPS